MGRDWYYWGTGKSSRSSKKEAKTSTEAFGGDGGRHSRWSKKGDAKTAASARIGDNSSMKETNNNSNSTVSSSSSSGCMSAVFQLFDVHHHFHFPMMNSHHHHHDYSSSPPSKLSNNGFQLPPHHHIPKGVEAPRNSFESTQEAPLSSPTAIRKEENLNISMGIKIKTKPTTRKLKNLNATTDQSDSTTPSARSPNLVARLMGLDLIPDKSLRSSSSSPCSSSAALSIDLIGTPNLRNSKTTRTSSTLLKHRYSLHRNSVDGDLTGGTRSLPETPRISLGRRSDVDYYQQHRLSLQINRENVSEQGPAAGRFASSRHTAMKTSDNKENRSPRDYARQIVMQVKENVSRRVGSTMADITNISRNHEQTTDHRHQNQDSKKTSNILTKSKSASPRAPQPTDLLMKSTVKIVEEELKREQKELPREILMMMKCSNKKRILEETKYCSRMLKPPQKMQEEPFIRMPRTGNRSSGVGSLHQGDNYYFKKYKKTPLSNVNCTVPSLIPFKKNDHSAKNPSNSNLYVDALKVKVAHSPRRSNTQLHCCPSQGHTHIVRRQTTSTTSAAAAVTDYITRILRRAGVDRDTPSSYAKWFSPSHPLDPSIFYFLEDFAITSENLPANLGLRCNRKLLFHLIDEILVGVLKPHMNTKPWVFYTGHRRRHFRGSELIEELCERIGRFPLAECRVLEDIDALVAGDLPETEVERHLIFEEEGDAIVTELEREILETLVSETASDYIWKPKRCRFGIGCQYHVGHSRDDMLAFKM